MRNKVLWRPDLQEAKISQNGQAKVNTTASPRLSLVAGPSPRTSRLSRFPCRTSKPPVTSGAGNCDSSSPPAAAWSNCSPNPSPSRRPWPNDPKKNLAADSTNRAVTRLKLYRED